MAFFTILIYLQISNVHQQCVVIALIIIHFLAVDQQYNHRLLINAIGIGVDQHPVFFRQTTCTLYKKDD